MASSDIVEDKSKENISCTAAIDFGTSHTGYAVSFKGDESNIITGKHGGLLKQDRVPTDVLLNPDETFNSFGYEAENVYSKLKPDERKMYYYFKTFKMKLHKPRRLSRKMLLVDTRGRHMSALDIFSTVIWYLKGLVYKTIEISKLHQCKTGRIQWMLSVPAIWPDEARQFMRAAATAAEIDDKDLRLVLEPEAASLFCREQRVQISGTLTANHLSLGHKYILADLGGGTADICVHEILESGRLRELYRATGGDFGGTHVDTEFTQFLKELVCEHILSDFQDRYMSKYLKLLKHFQQEKENFSSETEQVNITLEFQLIRLLEDAGKNLQEIIPNTQYNNLLEFEKDDLDLVVKPDLMKRFFKRSLDGIIGKLREIIQACAEDKITTLLLVGGFSGSLYVRKKIEDEMQSLRVVPQPDYNLSVLKGAILMGYKPESIIQRRAKFTYGIAIQAPFIEGRHPENRKFVDENGVFCEGIFRRVITKDQLLELGKKYVLEMTDTHTDQSRKRKKKFIKVYRSTHTNPRYCSSEEGCVKIGSIKQKAPEEGWPDLVESVMHLMIGETELRIANYNEATGQTKFAYIELE